MTTAPGDQLPTDPDPTELVTTDVIHTAVQVPAVPVPTGVGAVATPTPLDLHFDASMWSTLRKLFRGEAKLSDKISEHMEARLPVIGSLESISTARELLSDADTLMVTFVGAPVGILTRHDLLAYLSN